MSNRPKIKKKDKGHNYFQPAIELGSNLVQQHGPGVFHIGVFHDNWCDLYTGKGDACNCNPEVEEIEIQ